MSIPNGVDRARRSDPHHARVAFLLTIAGIALYAMLDVVAQLLPPHYSAVTQAESDLAVGPFGFVMTINFVVRGLLSLAFVYGMWYGTTIGRRSPRSLALLGAWGIGAFLLAAFPTDVPSVPVSGHGAIHLVVASIAFLAAAIAVSALSYGFGEDPVLASLRAPAILLAALSVLFLLVLWASTGHPRLDHGAYGLVERLFLGSILLWMLLVSVDLGVRSPASIATPLSEAV